MYSELWILPPPFVVYFCQNDTFDWASILDHTKLLDYFEQLDSIGIGVNGRLTKMDRVSSALKYLRFIMAERGLSVS